MTFSDIEPRPVPPTSLACAPKQTSPRAPSPPPVKKLHLPLNLCWRRGLNRVAHKGAVVIISPIVAESPMKLQFFNFILRAALYNVQNSCRIIYGQNTEKILFLFIKRWRIIILTPLRFDRARKTLITKKKARRHQSSLTWHTRSRSVR